MQVDQKDDADRRGSQGSDPGDSGSTPQPSSKLRDKLQKFAKWRIDSSSIEFLDDGPEFRGGFATVSRAILVSASGSKSRAEDSAHTGGEKKSDGGTPGQKAVAVKKLKIGNGNDKERVLGLALREAGFLTELSHENVIGLEGFVEDLSEDRVWLVFPLAANGNLKDFVASANWDFPERIWLINDVASGVEYLHTQDPPIYHGDLKSVNVLVNSEYRAIITDFGSARRLAPKGPAVQLKNSEKETQPALLLETEFCEATNTVTLTSNQYTLRWAAPELLQDDQPGLWSDIWALGWIFYEVMTGAIPFQDVRKDSAVVICVIQGKLPSVADHAGMVLIRRLYSLMITCWSLDPGKRPTAEDCRKSIHWMPMISPDRQKAANMSVSQTRSPELLMKMGDMHRIQHDYINASKFLTEALETYTETADKAGKANTLFSLAEVNRAQGIYSKASQLYSEVIQIQTDIGNRRGRANALCCLADVHRVQNQFSEAVRLYSEALQIFTDIGNRPGRAAVLVGLAHVHGLQNEYSEAIPLYSEVLQIYTNLGDSQGRADALWGLAEMHRLQKEYSQAVQLFSEVLQISIDAGYKPERAQALMGLADVHHDQDQHEEAIPLYAQAAWIFGEIGKTRDSAAALACAVHCRQKVEPMESE